MKPTVLIVDDDKGIRELITQVLEREGFSTTSVENGESCLELLGKNKFDLLIIDIVLPGLGGMEILMNINNKYPKMRIIIISGMVATDSVVMRNLGSQFGASAILAKPLENKVLLREVKKVLS
jgi:DNA-binding NtrC family response regulator